MKREWVLVGLVALSVGVACGGAAGGRSGAPAAPAASAPAPPGSTGPTAPGGQAAVPPAAPVPPKPIKVAYGFVSTSALPLWVGEDQGIYEKHGLKPDTIYLQSSSQVAPAMASGEVETALTAVYGVVEIDLAGGDQVILASVTNYMPFLLHARPEIRRVEDLRGQRLAVTRFGGGISMAAHLLVQRAGLTPGPDVTMIQAGTAENQVNGMLAGAFEAAMVDLPANFVLEREGYPLLANVYDARIPSMHGVVAVTRPYLEQNRDTVLRFLRGFVETLGVIQRDKETTKRVLGQRTNTTDDDILERSYQIYAGQMTDAPFPSPAGLQTVLEERAADLPAARDARPEQFIDERPIRELEASGFIREHLRK
jgi:ABC-type nitrate/sulfonate/bicarbonate transport system substrate-binding protein